MATYAEGYDIPALVTRNERNEFTESVATVADHHLECEQTRMGPRVVGKDFETLVYPVDDSAYYQTTFAYWRQLLAARGTRHAGQRGTDNADGVDADADSGGCRDRRHS